MVLGDVEPGVNLDSLERELRQGVEHLKPGQHRAFTDDDAALLLYVDAMGHACIVPCERGHLGGWVTMGVAYRAGASGHGRWDRLPRRYKLSKASLEALDNAKAIDP